MLIGAHLLVGLWQTWRLRKRPEALTPVRQRWYARSLEIAGIEVRWHGDATLPPGASALVVSNHVSWLDIPVLGARFDPVFVAKAEIAHWPLIGWMSRYQRVLFLKRGAHQSGRLASEIQRWLTGVSGGESSSSDGEPSGVDRGRGVTAPVAVFPEATTSNGLQMLGFHARLFAPAIDAGVPVQPVAIGYRREPGETFTAAAFIEDVPLMRALWTVLCRPRTVVDVHLLPALTPPHASRDALARASEQAIAATLGVPVSRRRAWAQRPERPPDSPSEPL